MSDDLIVVGFVTAFIGWYGFLATQTNIKVGKILDRLEWIDEFKNE